MAANVDFVGAKKNGRNFVLNTTSYPQNARKVFGAQELTLISINGLKRFCKKTERASVIFLKFKRECRFQRPANFRSSGTKIFTSGVYISSQ